MSKIVKARKELTKLIELAKSQNGYLEIDYQEELYKHVSESFEDVAGDPQIYNYEEQFKNSDDTITIVFLSGFSMRIIVKDYSE